MALRHLERAVSIFGRSNVFYLQAPHRTQGPRPIGRSGAFAQLLSNLGFGDDDTLFALACAWRNLIRSAGPDLIVCDHAPMALLAARAFPEAKRAVIGSGFCVPPDVSVDARPANGNGNGGAAVFRPWAPLRPALIAADPAPAVAVEAEVLSRVNWLPEDWGAVPLERLGQLYSDADQTFLKTFPELDHFGARTGVEYWGPAQAAAFGDAESPCWPDGGGKRAFAYLKATPVAEEVLAALGAAGCRTVAYIEGIAPAARKRLESSVLHLAAKPVDVARASRECDLAVLNGGHGVTAEMLLAAVPLVLEQQMTGDALRRLGAGESAPPRRGSARRCSPGRKHCSRVNLASTHPATHRPMPWNWRLCDFISISEAWQNEPKKARQSGRRGTPRAGAWLGVARFSAVLAR